MPVSSHNLDDRKLMTVGAYIWRTALVLFTVTVVLCSSVGFWYFQTRSKHLAELNGIIEDIRAQQGPLTGPEIDAYYGIPDGEEDLTADYLAAISVFDDFNLTLEQQQLPLIGCEKPVATFDENLELLSVAEDYLQKFEPQLNSLRGLAHRKGSVRYPVRLSEGFSVLLPHAKILRFAAGHLQLQYWVYRHRGDRQRALANVLAIFRASETLKHEPMVVSQLVRFNILSRGIECSVDFLNDQRATESELALMANILESINLENALHTGMVGERAMAYSVLQMKNARELNPTGKDILPHYGAFGTIGETRPGDASDLMEVKSEFVNASLLPFPEAIVRFNAIANHVRQRTASEHYNTVRWNRHFLAVMFLPANTAAAEATGRALSFQSSLRTAIAVEQFRIKHGRYPTSAQELILEFLPRIPTDPFSGKSVHYRLDEASFTVYTTGSDMKDDGGTITAVNRPTPLDYGVRIEFSADLSN